MIPYEHHHRLIAHGYLAATASNLIACQVQLSIRCNYFAKKLKSDNNCATYKQHIYVCDVWKQRIICFSIYVQAAFSILHFFVEIYDKLEFFQLCLREKNAAKATNCLTSVCVTMMNWPLHGARQAYVKFREINV